MLPERDEIKRYNQQTTTYSNNTATTTALEYYSIVGKQKMITTLPGTPKYPAITPPYQQSSHALQPLK